MFYFIIDKNEDIIYLSNNYNNSSPIFQKKTLDRVNSKLKGTSKSKQKTGK